MNCRTNRLLRCLFTSVYLCLLVPPGTNLSLHNNMSDIATDVNCIMALFKEAAVEHDSSQGKPDIPEYMYYAMKVMLTNILEREDNAKKEMKEDYTKKLNEKQNQIDTLKAKYRKCLFEIDAQAQYNRSENLKIHGIEYKSTESVNEITKDIAKYTGVKIEEGDISCGHRLMSKHELEKRAASTNKSNKIPQVIMRFNRRDIKDKLLASSKNLQFNVECPEYLKSARLYEDVTPLRSRIMYQLRNKDDKKAFKYVWSRGLRIFARTHEQAAMTPQPKPYIINNPDDLLKLGFSEDEVDAIIEGDNNH